MRKKIQFVQGIYIRSGGANVATTSALLNSLEIAQYSVDYVEIFPNFENQTLRKLCTLVLALPFSILRGRLCLFEFFYKISTFSLMRFLFTWQEICVLNHHSTFYLAPLSKILGQKVILIVHDSVYLKACRSGERRFFLNATWKFERFIMRFADHVLFVSDSERQYCESAYNLKKANLVSIMSNSEVSEFENSVAEPDFCIIGDWRRAENLEGLEQFLKSDYQALTQGHPINIFGLGLPAHGIKIPGDVSVRGKYDTLASLPYRKFIVPIWAGAGVKRKVLELLFADRIVFGTDVAFDGLPSGIVVKNIIRIDNTDGKWKPQYDNLETDDSFALSYFAKARPLGELIS